MWVKENIKKSFNNKNKLIIEKYKATKFLFIISGFLFFLDLFLLWAWFYNDLLIRFFPFLYITFSFLFCLYLYFYFNSTLNKNLNLILEICLWIVLFLIFIVLNNLFFVKDWLFDFVKNTFFS